MTDGYDNTKVLLKYRERNGQGYPSLRERVRDTPPQNKSLVLAYLHGGKVFCAAAGILRDVLIGERIRDEEVWYTDGGYCWSTEMVYYYAKYNVALPEGFVAHVTKANSKTWRKEV